MVEEGKSLAHSQKQKQKKILSKYFNTFPLSVPRSVGKENESSATQMFSEVLQPSPEERVLEQTLVWVLMAITTPLLFEQEPAGWHNGNKRSILPSLSIIQKRFTWKKREKEEKEKEKYLTYLNLQKKIVQHLREVAIVVYSRTYLNFSPKSLNTRMNCFPEMKSK